MQNNDNNSINLANIDHTFNLWVKEQRRKRRWSIAFKLFFVMLFVALFWKILQPFGNTQVPLHKLPEHAAIIDIDGVISSQTIANADNIAASLRAAFDSANAKGLILRINSPGGSPVQSGYVYDEIIRLKMDREDFPVYAVCVDVCASGAYEIAVAADYIFANRFSIVGSIGVIMPGFGFVDTLEKLGVERRLMTAGKNKGFMDPFSPLEPQQQRHAQRMLDNIHQRFIDDVKMARGDRLVDNDDIFSGLVWTADEAYELGLIDGYASAGLVARDIIGTDEVVDYTIRPTYWERISGYVGTSISNGISQAFGFSSNIVE